MRFSQLSSWLQWLEQLPPQTALGLANVQSVAEKMGLLKPTSYVISVAGTNGKGSCVALLEAILLAGGHQVGAFTSPHLYHYNERIKINNEPVSDDSLCEAFAYIEQSRQGLALTYFEFTTLAALYLFQQQALEVIILEVGLGGRLDAVNVMDADLALITGIDFDHEHYLGHTREAIGFEKAGIMRLAKPAVYGDAAIPQTILTKAEQLKLPLYCYGRDYQYQLTPVGWEWQGNKQRLVDLPLTQLPLANAAAVLQVHELLPAHLQIPLACLKACLSNTTLAGRFQRIQLANQATVILDVAHNPQACELLARRLEAQPCEGISYAIVAMMADKAIFRSLKPLQNIIEQWYITELAIPRAASADTLAGHLRNLGITAYFKEAQVATAYQQIATRIKPEDRLIVFGSFYTVAQMLAVLAGQ